MSKCVKNVNPSDKVFGVNCDDGLLINGDSPNVYPDGRVDPCLKAPCGEPRLLTLLANAIYDESGINLCRSYLVTQDANGSPIDLSAYQNAACSILLEVIDYDLSQCTIDFIQTRPNCVNIKLTNVVLTLAARVVDSLGRILTTFNFKITYLIPNDQDESYDPDTNPTSICTELYAPYGVSYTTPNYSKVIEGIGYISKDSNDNANNTIPQGISLQAMAKVLSLEFVQQGTSIIPELTIGITLMLRSSYIVEYKFEHAGISVPPKAVPMIEEDLDCIRFVEGDLLAKNVKPLEFRRNVHHTDPLCPCYHPRRQNNVSGIDDTSDNLDEFFDDVEEFADDED